MSVYEKLKQKFVKREKILATAMLFFHEPLLIEKMKRNDLDFLVFDMEHASFNTENLVPYLHMCRLLELPSVVRVQDTEYHLIAKTIDMGADGIMLPRVETLDQLQIALDALCFYPVGKKGNGGSAQYRKGESFNEFQCGRFLIPQIESPKGIDNLPEMIEKLGDIISGVIIGPYDMSIMVGTPLDIKSAPMELAIQKVFDICQKHNMSTGIFCGDAEEASAYQAMGANILWTGCDIGFYMDGYNFTFDELAKL